MSVHTKVSGIWKEVTELHVKVSDVWKGITEGWVNISGVWKQFFSSGRLPENLIAFSISATVTGWSKMDGVEASPTLIGKYPKVANSQGGIGGALTHTHASFSGFSGYNGTLKSGGFATVQADNNQHRHSINHTHPAENNEPPYLNILPVTNGDEIKTTMFLFYNGASAPAGWSVESTAYNKFFKGASTPSGGSGSVNHSHSSLTDQNFSIGTNRAHSAQGTYFAFSGNHNHATTHIHSGGQNEPLWTGLLPVKPNSDTVEIPSGIIAFFKGSVIPTGWSVYSAADQRWIKGKSTGTGSGGVNSHNHVLTGVLNTAGSRRNGGSGTIYIHGRNNIGIGHNHTMNHSHNTVDNIPPYQELMFLKKD